MPASYVATERLTYQVVLGTLLAYAATMARSTLLSWCPFDQ